MRATSPADRPRVAILLSTDAFETFYGEGLGLDRDRYVATYRNDWSWEFAEALRRQGLDPWIYVASTGPSEARTTADGIGVRFLGLTGLDRPWRRIPALRRTPVGRYAFSLANTRGLLPSLRAALVDDRPVALLVQEYWNARWDVLARSVALPLVAIDQGMPDHHEPKLAKRATLPRAARVVVQKTAEADKVRRYGGAATRIPNGVDVDRYQPGDPDRAPQEIVVVARLLDAQKRISDLIRALALLPGDWTLRILGGGPDEAMLRELARSEGVADRVRFEGFVFDREVVASALRGTGVFAIPSTYEGLPMALLEAMSSGAAVVGSTIPAIAEVVTDGTDGVLVPTERPDLLAAAIQEAYRRRTELGAAARETIVREYSLEAAGRKWSALLTEIGALPA